MPTSERPSDRWTANHMPDSTTPAPIPTEVDGSRPRSGGPLALTAVTLGLVIWPLAFNFGAYREVHYGDVFSIVVAATILFVVTLVNPVYPSPWIWVVRVALAAPMAWLLTAAWLEGSTSAALDRPGFAVWMVLIVLVSVPITVRLLVDMFMPELTTTGSRKVLWSIVALVLTVGAIGFVVGRENPRFMTCADFAIAGSAEPENCADDPS